MIGVTQPRRVAALAVARRVAEEMNVPYGGKGAKLRIRCGMMPGLWERILR